MADLILLKDWLETSIEIWRPIKGFTGYDVSNQGRVRSYRRGGRPQRKDGILSKTPYVMNPVLIKNNYQVLTLYRNKIPVLRRVHKLVADAFIPNNRTCDRVVPNHLNNVHYDNRQDNLEWTTYSENVLHANDIGVGGRGSGNGRAKLTDEDVLFIRANAVTRADCVYWGGVYGMYPSHIRRILSRQVWQHI